MCWTNVCTLFQHHMRLDGFQSQSGQFKKIPLYLLKIQTLFLGLPGHILFTIPNPNTSQSHNLSADRSITASKRVLSRVRCSRITHSVFSFSFQCLLFFLSWLSSCLNLLPRLSVPSISPSYFPSTVRLKR
jgi:hypothetical protein